MKTFQRLTPIARTCALLGLAVFVLTLAPTAHAQNSRMDGIVFSRGGLPSPGASVTVCSQPVATITTPPYCSNLAALCSSLTDAVCASPNPVTADGLGNYHFYTRPGNYTLEFYNSGSAVRAQTDQLVSCGPTSACTVSSLTVGALTVGTLKGYDVWVNVVDDCLVDNTGVIDVSTPMNACFTAHPGAHFVFPAGTYKVSASMFPKGHGVFIDCGNAGVASAVVHFVVDAGVTTFVLANADTQAPRIEGCWFDGAEPWSSSNASTFVLPSGWGGTSDSDAIRCYAHGCIIRYNLIQDFGRHGINVDTQNYAAGNANNALIEKNRIIQCRGEGIHIQGGDSNAGIYSGNSTVSNQLGGEIDDGFLGNGHDNGHTDYNGTDLTTPASTKAITNSVIVGNYATITMVAHGFAVGDNLLCAGTLLSRLNGRWQVLNVEDADNVKVWSMGSDRASAADTGTCGKMPGSSGVWMQTLTGCSITNGSSTMTCTGGGYSTNVTGYPINIPGAGVAGANLVTWITASGTAPNTFSLRDAASTSVGPISTVTVIIRGVPYKGLGSAQFGGFWLNMYSEASQIEAQFNQANRVDGGDQGASVDSWWGGTYVRNDANGFHITSGGILYDTLNRSTNVVQTFKPGQLGTGGGGTNGSTLRIFSKASDGTQIFRETVGVNSWATIDVNSRNFLSWAPTASGFYSGGGEARIGSDAVLAKTSFRSNGAEVGSVSTTGLATFALGVVPGTAAGGPAGAVGLPFSNVVVGPAANTTANLKCTNCTGNRVAEFPDATIVVGQIESTHHAQLPAALVDQTFFVATRAYKVTACSFVGAAAETTAVTLRVQVTKDTSTNAPGAGVDLLTNNANAGFDVKATANTVQAGTLTSTAADLQLAIGDRLAVDYTAAATEGAGISITCSLQPN